jgi:hypothetical protein
VADATLRGQPLAACVIYLDGLSDIARLIDFYISDQLATAVLRRLPGPRTDLGAENIGYMSLLTLAVAACQEIMARQLVASGASVDGARVSELSRKTVVCDSRS